MRSLPILAAIAVALCLSGCGRTDGEKATPEGPPVGQSAEKQNLPSLDEAVSKLKTDLKDAADAAKSTLADNAGAEIERISKQLQEVADDLGKDSGKLEGEAKEQYEKMRIEFEDKKAVFEEKLKTLTEGSTAARKELLKGAYDALAEMKDALDRAGEAFRQGEAAQTQSKPS